MVTFKIVHCHPGLTYIFNFWHSGTLVLSRERQSAQMSEIKNVGYTWMAKCNQLTPLPLKGLILLIVINHVFQYDKVKHLSYSVYLSSELQTSYLGIDSEDHRKHRWFGQVLQHENLLHDIVEGKLLGKATCGKGSSVGLNVPLNRSFRGGFLQAR